MSQYAKHLYAIMYPNHALVASQLDPHEFGKHYSVGTARYYSGKMLFGAVDPEFRSDYFRIDEYLEQTVEHEDGSPKRTKFISSYRVLEHLDVHRIPTLYAVTVAGEVLELPRAAEPPQDTQRLHVVQELNPHSMLLATTFDHAGLGEYMTTPGHPKGCPTLFFTELDFDYAAFKEQLEANPYLESPIPGIHPQKLKIAVEKLLADPEPRVRTIGIHSAFRDISYRRVRKGFFLARGAALVWYPMPSMRELEEKHYRWVRSMA